MMMPTLNQEQDFESKRQQPKNAHQSATADKRNYIEFE